MAVNLMDNLELLVTQYQAAPKLKGIIAGLPQLIQQQQLDTLYQFEAGLAWDHATGWSLDRIGHNHHTNHGAWRNGIEFPWIGIETADHQLGRVA